MNNSSDAEALLSKLLMRRLERGVCALEVVPDVEATLRQAGATYRERVRPLDADEVKAAVQRLREATG